MKTFVDQQGVESKVNKTIKNVHNGGAVQQVSIENNNNTFSEIYSSVPKYGCLKGGNLPTYRSYCNRTVKSNGGSTVPFVNTASTGNTPFGNTAPFGNTPFGNTPPTGNMQPFINTVSTGNATSSPVMTGGLVPSNAPHKEEEPVQKKSIAERIKSPTELLLIEKVKKQAESTKPKPINKKIKKILRRTYRTGKDKYRPKVAVLLPNKTIRRNVTTKAYLLKQTPIEEVRKTLLKQGFIKLGSSAPNDVLLKMYESVQMIGGDVNNHNPDNLLYNFLNDKGKLS
jgi:hypothetical protein